MKTKDKELLERFDDLTKECDRLNTEINLLSRHIEKIVVEVQANFHSTIAAELENALEKVQEFLGGSVVKTLESLAERIMALESRRDALIALEEWRDVTTARLSKLEQRFEHMQMNLRVAK